MHKNSQRFEWNEHKRLTNLEKHGIDFKRARQVFADPRCLVLRARQHHSELRELAIGSVDGHTIAVIFTRRGETIRIISARVARRIERQVYE